MPDFLINGSYPQEYWNLPNIDEEIGGYELWWSSDERVKNIDGIDTAEYVEIDYGRKRVVNYMSFDITRKPVNITIEYDAWSHGDRNLGSDWRPVTPVRTQAGREDTEFDSFVSYSEGANIQPWEHVQFFFMDENGEAITTQRLRIRFERRDAEFPRPQGLNPSWSIDVRNMRTARYVVDLQDARGVLLESPDWSHELLLGDENSVEVRQTFTMPGNYVRSPQGGFLPPPRDEVITEMVPSIVGFGFYCSGPAEGEFPTDENDDPLPIRYFWALCDVTDGENTVLKSGVVERQQLMERGWIDVLLNPDQPIPTEDGRVYQLRLRSGDLRSSNRLYIKKGNPLKDFAEQDTTNIDAYIMRDGDATQLEDTAILFRIWGDIGESGKDIFGNEYREGVRRDAAANVSDETIHTNWLSGPNPDPAAVECLYFDIRTLNEQTTEWEPSIIDSVRVNPMTPGIFMTLYYSNDNYRGNAPTTVDYPDGWEGLRWTPVIPPGHPYQLLREQTFDLPHPIRASFVCLEFTSLQALPFALNEFPDLPALRYKTFPDSVYNRLLEGQATFDDYLPNTTQRVQVDVFSLFQTSDEFNYRRQNDPAITSITGSGRDTTIGPEESIDPRTLAQILFTGVNMYHTSLPTKTDPTSVVGQFVQSTYSFGNKQYAPRELTPRTTGLPRSAVSNTNDRDVQAYQTQTEVVRPLWFPQIERHPYAVTYGKFRNKKAYFAGISEVRFLRRDYTIERDDVYIHDVLADSQLIDSPLVDFSTWQPEIPSTIPPGVTVWITYTVGPVTYQETVQFEPSESDARNFEPVLLTRGGARATNVQVHSGENQTGTLFVLGKDYDMLYDQELGANYIQRNSLHYRLVSTNIKVYEDLTTVTGKGVISAVEEATFAEAGTGVAVAGASSGGVVVGPTYNKSGGGTSAMTAKGAKLSILYSPSIVTKKNTVVAELTAGGSKIVGEDDSLYPDDDLLPGDDVFPGGS